jgi:type IV pili sensor histidine kinase/response regulator
MLEAITQEARAAFLEEDAPECIEVLVQGCQRLCQSQETSPPDGANLYKRMGRAAHSLKGGAGMASLTTLQGLCHHLEALFEALEQGQVQDTATAGELIAIAIDSVQAEVNLARQSPLEDPTRSPLEISQALEAFLAEGITPAETNVNLGDVSDFVRTALVVELEACLERVEQQVAAGLTGAKLWESFQLLLEECTLLGQALSCDWLTNRGQGLELSPSGSSLAQQITTTIVEIRTLRDQFLARQDAPAATPRVTTPPVYPVEHEPSRPSLPVPPSPSSAFTGGMDADLLAAIAVEARQAFLEEDAPDCLAALSQGFGQLQQALDTSASAAQLQPIFKTMGRAAHSLKGGAGMAELPTINRICHRMEDVFEALERNKIQDIPMALQLLSLALDEVQSLVDAANTGLMDSADAPPLEITQALEDLLAQPSSPQETPEPLGDISDFVRITLTTELENRLGELEQQLQSHQPAAQLLGAFQAFLEECILLGQALSCPWLEALAEQARPQLTEASVISLIPKVIANLRHQREQFLAVPEPMVTVPAPLPREEATAPIEVLPASPSLEGPAAPMANERRQSLRIPLERLIRMSSVVSELLINHEQLLVYDRQLRQASLNLKNRNQQLVPLREQVESLYDELSFSEQNLAPIANAEETNGGLGDFDALEFDRYTSVHSLLQRFQEMMVQVQEIQDDVEAVERDLQETLIQVRQSLHNLDEELTQSRLLPFGNLARSFIQPLAKLNQRHQKNVQLDIIGESVLLELTVFEQLRTPLTHLIRNAFDHGMETPDERLAVGKSPQGTITLAAALTGNQITITLADDGRGIDPEKIRQKAVTLGLISEAQSQQASKEAIFEYLFSPGFSTAETVSDLSGRGLGLDIVKQLVDSLRGNLRLDSQLGQGTRFLIRIPLSLNIMPLLLIRTQQRLLAFPSENVLRVIPLQEYTIQDGYLEWQGQTVRVCPLEQLLHYSSALAELAPARPANVGLMVDVGDRLSVLTVEQIVDERPLVVKAFDPLTPLPTYLGGCTVLGTGEVVPIFLPNNLDSLWNTAVITPASPIQMRPGTAGLSTDQNTILVIDDSVTVRRTLNRVLGRSGYQVLQCRDGQEAWDLLNRQSEGIALAICDLEMPNMDGFTLMRLVRSHPTWQDLPIIVLTSRENPLHRQRASELGATHYLTKPFQPNTLLDTLTQVLTH